jgi:hypothetical protein
LIGPEYHGVFQLNTKDGLRPILSMVIVQLTALQSAFPVEHEARPPLDIEFGGNLSIKLPEM